VTLPPFPKYTAADPSPVVSPALSSQLLALVETEPQTVAEQVRAWLLEDRS
jgi:hypothetical protein